MKDFSRWAKWRLWSICSALDIRRNAPWHDCSIKMLKLLRVQLKRRSTDTPISYTRGVLAADCRTPIFRINPSIFAVSPKTLQQAPSFKATGRTCRLLRSEIGRWVTVKDHTVSCLVYRADVTPCTGGQMADDVAVFCPSEVNDE
jgi:hypothetical protein